ncbi:hypothetical protein [uncultured Mucilaginibacter sp.]|uniref:hypothetical protein n=1 Tax=uncultured Mucilaginibacter sp. TaxID=797541 RepID=UPI0026156D45|nr:hypothetical protein [uncultured Mucilaginibacter sp.]
MEIWRWKGKSPGSFSSFKEGSLSPTFLTFRNSEMERYAPRPFSPFEGGQGDDLNFYPIKEASAIACTEIKPSPKQLSKPILPSVQQLNVPFAKAVGYNRFGKKGHAFPVLE